MLVKLAQCYVNLEIIFNQISLAYITFRRRHTYKHARTHTRISLNVSIPWHRTLVYISFAFSELDACCLLVFFVCLKQATLAQCIAFICVFCVSRRASVHSIRMFCCFRDESAVTSAQTAPLKPKEMSSASRVFACMIWILCPEANGVQQHSVETQQKHENTSAKRQCRVEATIFNGMKVVPGYCWLSLFFCIFITFTSAFMPASTRCPLFCNKKIRSSFTRLGSIEAMLNV